MLLEQAAASNLALLEHGSERATEAVATGLLGRLDLRTGTLALVNAGHVPPFLYRAGTVTQLALPTNLPLGKFADAVTRAPTSSSSGATGWCWSPTACSRGERRLSTWSPRSGRPARSIPARPRTT